MVCRNICETVLEDRSKPMHNLDGKKYCRTCEIYFYHEGQFCPCCGMQLRTTPIDTKDKAKIKKRLQKQVIH
jgi:rRNA maturation endonuclease Nob1